MADLPIEFCRQVAKARRAKGLTQNALSRIIGCTQSAISMFEGGHPEKLSIDFVKKAAEILEIPLEDEHSHSAHMTTGSSFLKKGYCPNAACLSNIPYEVNGEVILWPSSRGYSDDSRYCNVCGEVLEFSCPECGCDVSEGAFCERCGKARVICTLPAGLQPEDWIKSKRTEIRELKVLMRADSSTSE